MEKNSETPAKQGCLATGGLNVLIGMAFEDANNQMKDGTLMRQVINKVNDIDFNGSDDRHMSGDICEKLLKNPHASDNGRGVVDLLLPEFEKFPARLADTGAALKQELREALCKTN